MNDTSSDIFTSTACTGPAWDFAREQLTRRRNNNAPLEGFRSGMAVRDLLNRYSYVLDQRDIDGLMDFFADDCVVNNRRGTHVGAEAIRADLEGHFRDVPRSMHMWSNIVVRLSEDFDEARVSSYFYAMLAPRSARPQSVGGLVADRIAKRDGKWLICERTTSVGVAAALTPVAPSQ